MANERINKMMKQALVEAKNFTELDGKSIQGKYIGAISSFGVSIIGSGLRATILFYEAKKGKFEKFESSIENILNTDNLYNYDDVEHVLDAVTALKLAMRTFKKIDNTGAENE